MRQKKAHFVDDALKTRGIVYSNVEIWLLFAPPYQNFWLRACAGPPSHRPCSRLITKLTLDLTQVCYVISQP